MGLNDDGQMTEVLSWVNTRVFMAELNAYRDGAPRDYIVPITMWGMVVQFYVEQLEDHSAPGPTFLESEPSVQLACVLDMMRRGAQALDSMVDAESSSLIAGIEEMLSPGSELDTDEPAGTEPWRPGDGDGGLERLADDQPEFGSSEDL